MKSSFDKWLICIFSYNRPALLRNILNSISEFYPDMHIAIFDDGSNDKNVIEMLDEMKKSNVYVYVNSRLNTSCKHGGLYKMMNLALAYAVSNSYQYAYYVQEDMQFLWRDDELNNRVEKVFAREECIMCLFNFLQKIVKHRTKAMLTKINNDCLYSFEPYAVFDTGVIDLQKAEKINLNFPFENETENGILWYNKGYRLYWVPFPHLAWTPWPITYRFKKKTNGNVFALKPLNKNDIRKLLSNKSLAFLEDFTKSETFKINPYWYMHNPGWPKLIIIYIKYYLNLYV